MRISLRRSLLLPAAIAMSAALGISAFTSTANASSKPAGNQAKHEYCATLLATLQPHQTTSRVISQKCSDQHVPGTDRPVGFVVPVGGMRIWTGYQYTNYKGLHWSYWAKQPCDNKGYKFTSRQDGWGISSWQAHAGCWHTTIYYDIGQQGRSYSYRQGVWEAGQIGSGFDNHVWSVWTRRQ